MSDNDRTIIKPRPGGSRPPAEDKTVIKPRPASQRTEEVDHTVITPRRRVSDKSANSNIQASAKSNQNLNWLQTLPTPGLSPLLNAASPVLSAIAQLKQIDGAMNIDQLREQLSQKINQFVRDAKKQEEQVTVSNASYALCATIDEAVLNMPWGENSHWSQKPLLSLYHKETYGGEKFYKMLDSEINSDINNYAFIELLYLCLSLGFMGKMRIDPQGSIKVEKIRAHAYQMLVKQRNQFRQQLSPNAKPAQTERNRLFSFLPIWLLTAALVLMGFFIFQHWLLQLNQKSDSVMTELAALLPAPQEESLPEGKIRQEILFLKELLKPEIERNVLSVDDYLNRSSITLHASELFGSGSADINTSFNPILDKIAKALESIPGKIMVYGHTDNIAIRTTRYPSNWHLSLARASAVSKYLSEAAELRARVLPEGRGDSEPLADNSTAEGRAKNRRVTIELFYE